MSLHRITIILSSVGLLVLLSANMFGQAPLGTPKAGMDVPNLVPFQIVEKIACKKAVEKWGEGALGPAVPCCDDDGDIVVYMFPFAIGAPSFPSYPEILSSVKEWRQIAKEGLQAMPEAQRAEAQKSLEERVQVAGIASVDKALPPGPGKTEGMRPDEVLNEKWARKLGREGSIGAGRYGTVVVSARYDRFPVPLYMHYLPPCYAWGDLAAEKAADALATASPALERIYFRGPSCRGQYFEFASNGQKALVNSYSLEVEAPEKALTNKTTGQKTNPPVPADLAALMAEEWAEVEAEGPSKKIGDHLVYLWQNMPEILWCRGCTPTSAAMILGYWDCSTNGYGGLIDYWQLLSEYVDGRTGRYMNVPNVLEELRYGMATDDEGGTYTYRGVLGIRYVVNQVHGYPFNVFVNTTCVPLIPFFGIQAAYWEAITYNIDADMPFLWGVHPADGGDGHSLAAWGYTDDKFIVTYNTWDYGRDDWYYLQYDNRVPALEVSVRAIWPRNPDADSVFLRAPAAGAVLTPGLVFPIRWYHGNCGINSVDLMYSVDSGNTWRPIVSGLPDEWWMDNTYNWVVPDEPGDFVRVRICGYMDGRYLSGDGYENDCTIEDETVAYFGSPKYSFDESDGAVTIPVFLSRAPGLGRTFAVRWGIADDTATAGADYVASGGTLLFGSTDIVKTFTVTILEDALWENYSEQATLNLSDPQGCILKPDNSHSTLVILDNDMLRDEAGGWQTTFGGAERDVAYAVEPTDDGGYIMAGATWSFGSQDDCFYLVKVDDCGNEQWERTFGENDVNEAYAVQQTNDGGYVIAGATEHSVLEGNTSRTFYDILLIKTDRWGNETWRQIHSAGYDQNKVSSVQQTRDGGYVLAGYTGSWNDNHEKDNDVFLMKTYANGAKQWQRLFGGTNDDEGASAQQTSDDGYIITGSTASFGAGGLDVWLIKTDASGNPTWRKTFGGAANDWGSCVQEIPGNGYVVVGTTHSFGAGQTDAYLVKTNQTGDLEWSKTYGASLEEEGNSISLTTDGAYIITGMTNSPELGALGLSSVYTVKVDGSGNEEWCRTFGGTGEDIAAGIAQSDDGGYVIAGSTSSYGTGADDVYLVRIAPVPAEGLTISGAITGDVAAGVAMTATTTGGAILAETTTDAHGAFQFDHVPYAWSGRVIPSEPGYVADPIFREYSKMLVGVGGQDFVATAARTGCDWIPATEAAPWPGRQRLTAVSMAGAIWILGGVDYYSNNYRNDVWRSSDGAAWTHVSAAAPWQRRSSHASVVYLDRIWVLGGYYWDRANYYFQDAWSSRDGAAWSEMSGGAPWHARAGHAAVVHKGKMWVLGGYYNDGADHYLNDVWSSDGTTWTEVSGGAPWHGRSSHAAVVHNGKMWVLGGCYNDGTWHYLNDVWSSENGISWTEVPGGIRWDARVEHTALSLDGKMWVFGGTSTERRYCNDVWSSADGVDWTEETSGAEWESRFAQSGVVYDDRLWCIGGLGFDFAQQESICYNDAWYSWGASARLRIGEIQDAEIPAFQPYEGSAPVLERGDLPVSWSLVEGPAGMSIGSDGVVSWPVPTSSGSPEQVTIRATNQAAQYDETWFLTVTPPSVIESIGKPDLPSGPVAGQANQAFTYTTGGSTSIMLHEIEYCYDWGDGTVSFWSDSTSAGHMWSSTGSYAVKAQARCKLHPYAVSDWSDELVVVIDKMTVPNTEARTLAEARALIANAGLVLGTVTEAYSDTVPSGQVISQSPQPGEGVAPGSVVDLVVSKGSGNGSLQVTLEPEEARQLGAQWRIDGGEWYNSGATITAPIGQHVVSFKDIEGGPDCCFRPRVSWMSPVDQSVTISPGQTATLTGTYTKSQKAVTAGIPAPHLNGNAMIIGLAAVSLTYAGRRKKPA